jgi:hypothetical protein
LLSGINKKARIIAAKAEIHAVVQNSVRQVWRVVWDNIQVQDSRYEVTNGVLVSLLQHTRPIQAHV